VLSMATAKFTFTATAYGRGDTMLFVGRCGCSIGHNQLNVQALVVRLSVECMEDCSTFLGRRCHKWLKEPLFEFNSQSPSKSIKTHGQLESLSYPPGGESRAKMGLSVWNPLAANAPPALPHD